MAAVTYDFYVNTYNVELEDTEAMRAAFSRLEARAEDAVNARIRFRAVPAQFEELYQKAVCAQIDYYAVYGIEAASAGLMENSFTVGKVSVTGGGASARSGGASMISPQAVAYLEQTGLLNPAVPVAGNRGWW